jgi:hypothetical protein
VTIASFNVPVIGLRRKMPVNSITAATVVCKLSGTILWQGRALVGSPYMDFDGSNICLDGIISLLSSMLGNVHVLRPLVLGHDQSHDDDELQLEIEA